MLSEREADHSPLPSADIKKPYAVSAWCFDYHKDSFAVRQGA
jgi:hypothetical protein